MILYKLILTSEAVDETLVRDHSAVLSCGTIYYSTWCTRCFLVLSLREKNGVRTIHDHLKTNKQ